MKDSKWSLGILLISLMAIMTSCSTIYDDLNSCPKGCNVRFKYDYNMKWADAFANEVDEITLYLFDSNERYIKSYSEQGPSLKKDGFSMSLDLLPGTYTLVAVAGATGESFLSTQLVEGESSLHELKINMKRDAENSELNSLWHGMYSNFIVTGNYQNEIISLTKNTNKLRVVLQQENGIPLNVDDFTMSLNDDNKSFDYDNSIIKSGEDAIYRPYSWGSQSIDNGNGTSGSIAYAQFSLSRLMENSTSRLTIINKSNGYRIVDIPLIDYLLLTEMEGHNISAQEYLDRQDEYSLVFFLDDNLRWVNITIIVNGWTVRLNNGNLN